MKKVALVTYSKQPNLFDGDNLLVDPFKKHGIIAEAVPWDKAGIIWESFDLVILRSAWDYHYRIPEFIDWLNKLENHKVNLWNPVNIVRWNMNKKYLLELSNLGIPIIPTLIFNKETRNSVKEIIYKKSWQDLVIKPAVGASSYKIFKVKAQELDTLQDDDVIIQPFMKEVILEGELSFIFIDKKYSHAILKKPKQNEYRSQPEFGGSETSIKPDPQLIAQVNKILDKIDSPLLYARIDCVNVNNQLQLMELELIEPYLFFEKEKNSAENFVQAAISHY